MGRGYGNVYVYRGRTKTANRSLADIYKKSDRAYGSGKVGVNYRKYLFSGNGGMSAHVGSGAYNSLHLTVVQCMEMFSEINTAVGELLFKIFGKRMDKDLLCISLGYAKDEELPKKHEITVNVVK